MSPGTKIRNLYERVPLQHFVSNQSSKILQPTIISRLILSAMVMVMVFFSFGSSLSIDFGPIDDHEIFKFLGTDRRIVAYEIPKILWQQTEIGSWGEVARYRPSYYILRVLETTIFENRAVLWYANRLVMLSLTVVLLASIVIETFSIANRILKTCVGITFAMLVLSLNSLNEITMRLGPAETYLVLSFSVFLYSSIKILKVSTTIVYWHLNILAVLIAIGTKESAVALIPPFLYLLATQIRNNPQTRWRRIIQGSGVLMYASLIVLGPMRYIAKAGTDVYGSERSLSGSLTLVGRFFENPSTRGSSISLAVIGICFLINYYCCSGICKNMRVMSYLALTLYLGLVTEFVFYQGNFSQPRYLLITELSKNLLVVLCMIAVLDSVFLRIRRRQAFLGYVVLATFLVSNHVFENYTQSKLSNSEIGTKNAIYTSEYQEKISAIETALLLQNYSGIVIQLNNVWDYEPAYAISQYVAFLGNNFPVTLNLFIGPVAPGTETLLLNQLTMFQNVGSEEWRVQPKSQTLNTKNLCIVFNGASASAQDCFGVLSG